MNNIMENNVILFNNTLSSLIVQIADICPDSILSKYINIIKTIIYNNPDKIITQFIMIVLPDKDKIDKEDENYFLNKTYEKEAKEDNDVINKIFKFKDIWKKLTYSNKKMVIQYMKCLCYYSQMYLLTI